MVYWLVSLPLVKGQRTYTWELLQEKTSYGQQLSSNAKLEVPELRVGTIDTLLAHSDDLAKMTIGTEAIVAKIRRTITDITGAGAIATLKVENLPVESYLTRFRSARQHSSSSMRAATVICQVQCSCRNDFLRIWTCATDLLLYCYEFTVHSLEPVCTLQYSQTV